MPLFLKERKSLAVLFLLIFFQLVLISLQVPLEEKNYFERAIFSVFSPIQHGIFSFFRKIGEIWSGYFYLRDVEVQNRDLRKEIFSLRQENNFLRNTLKRLQEERVMEEKLRRIHENILAAQVIGLDRGNIYKSLVINRGSLDGLKRNMVVLDKYGHLLGRVIDPISVKEARVQLITDPESGVSVYSRENLVPGIISGDGEGGCTLKYVLTNLPKSEDVDEEEELMTSGFDGIFPKGILVGKIISITPTTSLFKKIRVKPYFDFRHLDPVAVLLQNPSDIF
ncbi:MAG: rod shape-determining protein MreC [Candidatus Aminicenantales bacterium]